MQARIYKVGPVGPVGLLTPIQNMSDPYPAVWTTFVDPRELLEDVVEGEGYITKPGKYVVVMDGVGGWPTFNTYEVEAVPQPKLRVV